MPLTSLDNVPVAERVTLIESEDGDWIQMYYGEHLVEENHSLNETMVLQAARVPYVRHEVTPDVMEMIGMSGWTLPKVLDYMQHPDEDLDNESEIE